MVFKFHNLTAGGFSERSRAQLRGDSPRHRLRLLAGERTIRNYVNNRLNSIKI